MQQEVSHLKNLITEQLSKDIVRRGKDFSFEETEALIQRAYDYFNKIDEEFWTFYPLNNRQRVLEVTQSLINLVQEIIDFNPQDSNAYANKSRIVNQINDRYRDLYDLLFLSLSNYLDKKALETKDIDALRENTKKELENVASLAKEAESIVNTLKETSAIAGTSKFSKVFETQATIHRNIAIAVGIALVILVIVSGVYVISILSELQQAIANKLDLAIAIQVFISKVILISFVSFIIYYVIRYFNANMHLYALNKHRCNCLVTFEAFVKASDDPQTKDTVLIQATKSIFDAGHTGFINSKDESTNFVEIFKSGVSQLPGK